MLSLGQPVGSVQCCVHYITLFLQVIHSFCISQNIAFLHGSHVSWLFGCSNKQQVEASGQVHALAALCLGKVNQVPIEVEARWALRSSLHAF
jgi:hypothetical protein